jgi:spore maturation protein A
MLNYIWLALIVIGISVAFFGDVHDISTNKYHNGEEFPGSIDFRGAPIPFLEKSNKYTCYLSATSEHLGTQQPFESNREYVLKAELLPNLADGGVLHIFADDSFPALWREIMKGQGSTEYLTATARWDSIDHRGTKLPVQFRLDLAKFLRLNSVVNDGVVKSAKTAVELCIGLIGIMALWLGIMRIAEQSGLMAKIAGALKPVMRRLFPDVPPEHPAMGAMIMNISANMLGLSNAATPFGLKAMEELNKLNAKAGTATDAMCTFLVINTSNVQLVPTTVIAIRAAAGSANPAEILGPVLVATFVSLVVGVTTAKLLAKLPVYRRQIERTKNEQ